VKGSVPGNGRYPLFAGALPFFRTDFLRGSVPEYSCSAGLPRPRCLSGTLPASRRFVNFPIRNVPDSDTLCTDLTNVNKKTIDFSGQ
jgi:hypothetical protein